MSRRRAVRERPAPYGQVVVDASLAVQWFAPEPGAESSARLLETQMSLTAPDIMPLEVANALWKKARRGEMPENDVPPALTRLLDSHLVLVPTLELLGRATRLALRVAHPVHDCLYLVLAQERGALLATADERLRRAASAQGIKLWRP